MMPFMRYRVNIMTVLSFALIAAPSAAADRIVEHMIVPSRADPAVRQFDKPNVALTDARLPPDAPLAVFMPGTGGWPENTLVMLGTIERQGYRTIGLEYDDEPPGTDLCPRDPNPACHADFREMRSYGTGRFPKSPNPVAEAIVPRLVALLKALDAAAPTEGWGGYLDGDQPRWDRIVLSGLSQGAGMAAYIAKTHAVRRVVLFSSPWDVTGRDQRPAPWLSTPSATPMDRWYASYHAREKTVPLIRAAYGALRLPAEHIHVLNHDLPPGANPNGPNPFHGNTIRDTRYAADWRRCSATAATRRRDHAGIGAGGKRRDRPRRRAAMAAACRPEAVQGADDGPADGDGPQDVRQLPRAATRAASYRADA